MSAAVGTSKRYVPHLPAELEFAFFNRSWYNRSGVERVMGFCAEEEYDEFMQTVLGFEHMLTGRTSGRSNITWTSAEPPSRSDG